MAMVKHLRPKNVVDWQPNAKPFKTIQNKWLISLT
ncbi:hypothetical protein ANRL1_03293 [Anaerolineae bacterium]|nr:hypothetical protein ANRL1_03293 [Anaerolineae bacterium]